MNKKMDPYQNKREWRGNLSKNMIAFYRDIDQQTDLCQEKIEETKEVVEYGHLLDFISVRMEELEPRITKEIRHIGSSSNRTIDLKASQLSSRYLSASVTDLTDDEEDEQQGSIKTSMEYVSMNETPVKSEPWIENKEIFRRPSYFPSNMSGIQRLHNQYLINFDNLLGKGRFSNVFSGLDENNNNEVAVKCNFNRDVAVKESNMMRFLQEKLRKDIPFNKYAQIVRLLNDFTYEESRFLVYEALNTDLGSLLKRRQGHGLSLNLVRRISMQLFEVLAFLEEPEVDIIHADLKPENILLVNQKHNSIKVADFGSAFRPDRSQNLTCVQNGAYRAPEVTLQSSPYTHAIDVWSVGCIMAELFLGRQLFPSNEETFGKDRIREMSKYLGEQPEICFDNSGSPSTSSSTRTLDDTIRSHVTLSDVHFEDSFNGITSFIDLLYKALDWCPESRITAQSAIKHPFFVAPAMHRAKVQLARPRANTDIDQQPKIPSAEFSFSSDQHSWLKGKRKLHFDQTTDNFQRKMRHKTDLDCKIKEEKAVPNAL